MDLISVSVLVVLLFDHNHAKTVQGNGRLGETCVMGGDVMGRCEEVRTCLKDGGMVQREGIVHTCQPEGANIIVCCRRPHLIAEELCNAWAKYWRGPEGHCVEETHLIVGGEDATPGEFPHIAIIGAQEGNFPILWQCGGTLVSPHYILTAAHCVLEDTLQYWVRLGEHDRNIDRTGVFDPVIRGSFPASLRHASQLSADTSTSAPSEQQISVAEVIRHPEYDFFKYYDIALLRLSTPARLTKRVLPACLPTNFSRDLTGKELIVAGWGWTSFGAAELTRILQKVNVPVVGNLECQLRNPDYNGVSIPKGILKGQVCAGTIGRDSCRGDSGGPLVDKVPRGGNICEHTVEGIVSFGRGCGELGVYTRVSVYLDWITGYIAPGGLAI